MSGRSRKPAVGTAVRAAFGVAGLVALVVMVRRTGVDAIAAAIGPAWRWLPVAFACEGARLVTEVLATYFAYGSRARLVPFGTLVRAHVAAYAVSGLLPASRAAGEATKAALLARYVGLPAATAGAATTQATTLIAGSLMSIPCLFAAYRLCGMWPFGFLLLGHGIALGLFGLGLRAASRASAVGQQISRVFARFATFGEAFHATSREQSLVPRGPLAAMVGGRTCQMIEYAVLARAVGIDMTVLRVLFAQGMTMISLAAGVFVPAQIGASEGIFALAAEALGTSVAKAMSVALLAHVVQFAWIGVGSATLVLWRAEPPEVEPASPAAG